MGCFPIILDQMGDFMVSQGGGTPQFVILQGGGTCA